MESDAGWLFIGGCPRSGTTAMAQALNRDARIVMGIERWKWLRHTPAPMHFAPPIFFNPTARETNGFFDGLYDELRERWAGGGVRFLGDKNPFYTKQLETLDARFSGARFLIMVRDAVEVANSFQARADNPRDRWPQRNGHQRGLQEWNLALADVQRFCASAPDVQARVFLVDYRAYFAGEPDHTEALYRFLQLDVTDEVRAGTELMRREWPERPARERALTEEALATVEQGRDQDLERWARERIAAQLT